MNLCSDFWHSGLRNPLLSTADFLTYDILRLPEGTLLARYVRIFATFFISGTIHRSVDRTAGIDPASNTAMTLFLMQAVGITAEDFAQWAFRVWKLGRWPTKEDRLGHEKGSLEGPTLWQKVLGYLWVGVWLIWTTPSWSYQNIRNDPGQLFPLSFVEARGSAGK